MDGRGRLRMLPSSTHNTENQKLRNTMIEVLPNDLLEEVFVRLQCKYVARCMLVCKRWLGVILSPQFRPQFLNRRYNLTQDLKSQQFSLVKYKSYDPDIGNTVSLISKSSLETLSSFFSDFMDKQGDVIQEISYSNGLVLLGLNTPPSHPSYRPSSWCVCDPITKNYVKVSTFGHGYFSVRRPVLICDRDDDDDGDDDIESRIPQPKKRERGNLIFCKIRRFKLVNISSLEHNSINLFVHSSESKMWNKDKIYCPNDSMPSTFWWYKFAEDPVIYKGRLHYTCYPQIVIIDYISKKLQTLFMPLEMGIEETKLGILCDRHLRLSQSFITNEVGEVRIKIWELLDDNDRTGKWKLLHTIRETHMGYDFREFFFHPFNGNIVCCMKKISLFTTPEKKQEISPKNNKRERERCWRVLTNFGGDSLKMAEEIYSRHIYDSHDLWDYTIPIPPFVMDLSWWPIRFFGNL